MCLNEQDIDLEELIDRVALGKSVVNKISGKCDYLPGSEKGLQKESMKGDFNPLAMPTASIVCYEEEEENKTHKRSRLAELPEYHSDVADSKIEEREKVETKRFSEEMSRKLVGMKKRKRQLLDDDTLCSNEINSVNEKNSIQTVGEKISHPYVMKDEIYPIPICSIQINKKQSEKEDNILQDRLNDPVDKESFSLPQNTSIISPSSTFNSEESVWEQDVSRLPNLEQLSLKESVPCNLQYNPLKRKLADITDLNVISPPPLEKYPDELRSSVLPDDIEMVPGDSPSLDHSSALQQEPHNLRKRIRKTLPPVKTRHTPLGLPKPLRLKKESFSIEEIYTNKNYSTPVPKMLETIFEYPKEEKDGTTRFAEKRKKQRAMFFCADPAERTVKKKTRKKFKKRSTRRNKSETEAETDTKLLTILASLDDHMKLYDLSP